MTPKRKSRPRRPGVRNMTRIALCASLLCAASYLVIPLPFTPIVLSFHSLAVFLIGLLLKPRHAAGTVLIYLAMGLTGLPVFAGATAGPSKLFGPTGGFYIGFLFAAVAISLLKGRRVSVGRYALVTVAVGVPIQHFFAVLLMCLHNGFALWAAVLSVSVPFLLGDVIKGLLAATIAAAPGLSEREN